MVMTPFKPDDRDGGRRDATGEMSRRAASSSGADTPSISMDESAIADFIAFFRLLDKWDQEARCHEKYSNCGKPAVFSLVAIISTLGITKRLQQSSPAVSFCDPCLRELCDRLCSDALSDGVNNAYTSVNLRLRERVASKMP